MCYTVTAIDPKLSKRRKNEVNAKDKPSQCDGKFSSIGGATTRLRLVCVVGDFTERVFDLLPKGGSVLLFLRGRRHATFAFLSSCTFRTIRPSMSTCDSTASIHRPLLIESPVNSCAVSSCSASPQRGLIVQPPRMVVLPVGVLTVLISSQIRDEPRAPVKLSIISIEIGVPIKVISSSIQSPLITAQIGRATTLRHVGTFDIVDVKVGVAVDAVSGAIKATLITTEIGGTATIAGELVPVGIKV